MVLLKQLPSPPIDRVGFPWTEETPPQYIAENLPKISIITPSFNQGKFIEETIRSVLLQGYPNLEYIIIDGGSTDETLEIIEKYSSFISYWISEPDEGQSHAINKGLAKATGEVFNWLNSDDYYMPKALLTLGQYFADDKHINVFCGQQKSENLNKKINNVGGLTVGKTVEGSLTSWYFYQPSTFFRLSVVRQLGGISSELFFCMDLELWINYLTHFGHEGIVQSDTSIAVFRLHENAKTHQSHNIRYSDHINLFLCLIDSSDSKTSFPRHFQGDNPIFKRYFYKNYALNLLNQKKLSAFIAENLIEYYCQYMSWQSIFSLYFYAFKLLPFQHLSWRFYFSPLIKIKRLIRPI